MQLPNITFKNACVSVVQPHTSLELKRISTIGCTPDPILKTDVSIITNPCLANNVAADSVKYSAVLSLVNAVVKQFY